MPNTLAPCAGVQLKALGPLLDWAAAVVPSRRRKSTPVFLFGTAGMRKLALPQQASLLVQIRTVLEASPFKCAASGPSPGPCSACGAARTPDLMSSNQ